LSTPVPFSARGAHRRRARRGRLEEQVLATRVEAGRIHERGELDLPDLVTAVLPCVVIDTTPSAPTVTEVALPGIVIGGAIGMPLEVTSWPCASTRN
jgi:hypothetical protein